MKIQFKLKTQKKNAKGYYPVYLVAFYHYHDFYFYTREKCLEKDWNDKTQRFKKSYPGYQEANDYLDYLEENLRKICREYKLQGIIPTPTLLKEALSPEKANIVQEKEKEKTFFDWFEEFLESAKAKRKERNTLKNYTTLRNHLRQFEEVSGAKLLVNDYRLQIHDKFIFYLTYELELAPNSIYGICKNLKVFFKFLAEERELSLHADWQKIKVIYVEVEKIFLTAEELEQLHKVELRDSLDKVRDVFLFACYTGLRYSDVSRLTHAHIQQKEGFQVIRVQQKKTKKYVEIALIPQAVEILEKYESLPNKALPVIVNQKMNSHLKEIGQLAGIDTPSEKTVFVKGAASSEFVPKYELMTTHIARHTFATQSLMRGMQVEVEVEVLQKILGHSKIQQTLAYAKIVDDFKHLQMLDIWKS